MDKVFLGDFEGMILTGIAALQENAYGAAINIEIRLEDKGYIKSKSRRF